MVEAAENTLKSDCLKCRVDSRLTQKLPLKLLMKVLTLVGRYWTTPNRSV